MDIKFIGGLVLIITERDGIELKGALKLLKGKCLPWWRPIWPGCLL